MITRADEGGERVMGEGAVRIRAERVVCAAAHQSANVIALCAIRRRLTVDTAVVVQVAVYTIRRFIVNN